MTKVGWYAVDKSTTLESNKSPLPRERVPGGAHLLRHPRMLPTHGTTPG